MYREVGTSELKPTYSCNYLSIAIPWDHDTCAGANPASFQANASPWIPMHEWGPFCFPNFVASHFLQTHMDPWILRDSVLYLGST